MMTSRAWLALAGLIIVLGATNYTIMQRQQVVDNGQPMLLGLRPVDPRSLMQGDYMVLRYAETVFPDRGGRSDLPRKGVFVVTLDSNNVATFARMHDGEALADNEALLQYKQVDARGNVRLGAESFFFQEGQAALFDPARFGVLHVDDSGKSVLVGLADEGWQMISAPDATTPE
ncbi:MAG: GDYXXLXY domain-containing protein [Gammaproteobacteria bacterium]|nr:GDYXXLXY domain-containing protein [Gammaproteobacteria bacterium]